MRSLTSVVRVRSALSISRPLLLVELVILLLALLGQVQSDIDGYQPPGDIMKGIINGAIAH